MKSSDNQYSPIGRCSDVGKIRAVNEDSMGDIPVEGGHTLIVADGMGGYRGGAIASKLVVEAIEEFFCDTPLDNLQKAMRRAVYLANERIHLRGQQDEELSRMGSTCVLAVVRHGMAYVAHVGDSRIYLQRRGKKLQRLTRDHTVVQHFVDVGLLSEEEAEGHPESHILSRALGPRAHVEPEVCEAPLYLEEGDRILLCSDGLTKMVSELEISSFAQNPVSAQEISERLVDEANLNGGEDNVTVLVYEYAPTEEERKLHKAAQQRLGQQDVDPLEDTATHTAVSPEDLDIGEDETVSVTPLSENNINTPAEAPKADVEASEASLFGKDQQADIETPPMSEIVSAKKKKDK